MLIDNQVVVEREIETNGRDRELKVDRVRVLELSRSLRISYHVSKATGAYTVLNLEMYVRTTESVVGKFHCHRLTSLN